jgi:putative transposase
MQIKTLRIRVKDRHAAELRRQAREVNRVWNYINELSERAIRERRTFMSAFDLQRYTTGSSKLLGLSAQTIQSVTEAYAAKRVQQRRARLQWRTDKGSRRNLGWVPFKGQSIKLDQHGRPFFNGVSYHVWDSYGLEDYRLRAGTFSEDTMGRWYLNVVVEVEVAPSTGTGAVGIDLGCKEAAVCSNGERLVGRWYRAQEEKIANAQRGRKSARVRRLHAKARNRRKDAQQKFTTKLVRENAAIFVGDVSISKMPKTRVAKSALDAGWGQIRAMLEYKCDYAGITFAVVDEAYTTQTCSSCGSLDAPGRPVGRKGLTIREWECDCGAVHDRDVNAARNILALGHERLGRGSTRCKGPAALGADAKLDLHLLD